MLQVATGTGWSLTDSHVHLDEPEYAQDLAEVLQASRQAGVRRWIVPGLTPARSVELPTLAAQHAGVFFALGWHPWFVAESPESGLRCLQAALQARPTGLVAIGECGLDARIDVPIGWQWPVLEAQIRLACDWELPLILHSRGTHNELLSLLGRYRPKAGGVLHAYAGSFDQAMQFWKLGFSLGIGGTITYERAAKTRKAVARLPDEALLLETDGPTIPLAGYQGQRNEPARVADVLGVLAALRHQDPVALAKQIEANVERRFFSSI